MNDISFEKAPVIELVAELRWTPPGVQVGGPGQLTVSFGPEPDEFFQRFSNEVAKAGFTQGEKTVPTGFPGVWHQVTWRFRKPGEPNTLLQVGPGIFSANALQPYRRWKDFRPTVELGIGALLAARSKPEKDQVFSGVSLRYINAFTTELREGKSPAEFISGMLGLKLTLPGAIDRVIDTEGQVSSTVNLLIPIANTTKVMSMTIGDGMLNAEAVAMFDVTVAEKNPVGSSAAEVMGALSGSRDIIHNCFLELTQPLEKLMKPQGAGSAT